MADSRRCQETDENRTGLERAGGTPGIGAEAAPAEKEEKLSRAVRLCPDHFDLQLLPHGKQPADPAAGGNHLQERKGVGVLRAHEGVRLGGGAEPLCLR